MNLNLDDDRFLLAGGWLLLEGYPSSMHASAEIYDSLSSRFIPAGRMGQPREGHAIVELFPGIPMVIGGNAGDETIGFTSGSSSVEIFDPNCGRFDGGR